MDEFVLLTLDDAPCGLRAPVLACRDALAAAGAKVDTVAAASDDDVDRALEAAEEALAAALGRR